MSNWDDVAERVVFNLEISVPDFQSAVPLKSKILDFGCGYGRVTNQLYGLGFRDLIGVDASESMICRGLNAFPTLDLRHLSDLPLPFPDQSFDAVITCAVFTCVPDQTERVKILDELHRVLKPNGVLCLAEFCSDDGRKFTSGMGVPMWHSQPKVIEGMLTSFEVELLKAVQSPTMSGHFSEAIHILARKN